MIIIIRQVQVTKRLLKLDTHAINKNTSMSAFATEILITQFMQASLPIRFYVP